MRHVLAFPQALCFMRADKAQEIIKRAMADRSVYNAMAARENEFWGGILPALERISVRRLSRFDRVRSSRCFQRWFTIEWNLEFNAFLHLVAPPGIRAAYLENDDTKTLFEVLLLLDHLRIEEKIVQPAGGQYLMRPRSVDDIPAKTTDG